LRFLST
jgi:hypothetical protein